MINVWVGRWLCVCGCSGYEYRASFRSAAFSREQKRLVYVISCTLEEEEEEGLERRQPNAIQWQPLWPAQIVSSCSCLTTSHPLRREKN